MGHRTLPSLSSSWALLDRQPQTMLLRRRTRRFAICFRGSCQIFVRRTMKRLPS
ncbi:hypothetical protein AOX55_0000856 [Sinorhizobium fredii CCBAU 25509]|nr:hypothetical protein AOX55_0000856 [Sinorhizobium fredii CCBAU 25509]